MMNVVLTDRLCVSSDVLDTFSHRTHVDEWLQLATAGLKQEQGTTHSCCIELTFGLTTEIHMKALDSH
jgi:hypothetical protein